MSTIKKQSWKITDNEQTFEYTEESATITAAGMIGAVIGGPVGLAVGAGVGVVISMIKNKNKD